MNGPLIVKYIVRLGLTGGTKVKHSLTYLTSEKEKPKMCILRLFIHIRKVIETIKHFPIFLINIGINFKLSGIY